MHDGHEFWARQLAGYHTPLRLPSGFSPKPVDDRSTVELELSEQQTAVLHAFARSRRLTVNTLVQGAWASLLSRYCGESDVVFGVTSSGRPAELSDAEHMIGPFAATTPLRVRVTDEPLLPWLRALQARQVEATTYEHVPLPDIHAYSQVPPGAPLFETVLAFENHPTHVTDSSAGQTNYPVTVIVMMGDRLRFRLTFDSARFDLPWMRRLSGHLRRILLGMTESGDRSPATLPMLSEIEHAELDRWNRTAQPIPETRLDMLVLARCRARPSAEAVVSPGFRLSYGELDARSAALAGRLTDAGAGPGNLVAVLLERGWEQVVAVLGILRSGAAYLPIDPQWPIDRIRRLLALGDCRLAITTSGFAAEFGCGGEVQPIVVDAQSVPIGQSTRRGSGRTRDLAYVIDTSGSTGQPKGVAIEHRSAVNTVLDINRRFHIGPKDRVLALSALSFDPSVWEIFGTLAAGATLVMPEPSASSDPARWVDWVAQERVTIWDSVPALLDLAIDNAADNPTRLSTLRLALLSGDWIPLSLPGKCRTTMPKAEIVSLGGATEGSIWSICYPIDDVDPAWDSIPYGRPLTNQTFHVLDGHRQPVPVGVTGELYIGGAGVARGYWRDEAGTNASFVRHPVTGERLYRTGDLGRRRPDGVILFPGRADSQVKINGFRAALPPVTRRETAGLVPLTYAQEMIQILNALTPGNTAYVLRTAVEFLGDLDVPALEAAVHALVERHSALRTLFQLDDQGQPGQIVATRADVVIPQRDLTQLPPEDAEREAGRILAEEAALTFEPFSGDPLFRFSLAKVAPRRHILLIAVDHLVCDGRSLGILTRDLLELYRAETAGEEPHLPPLPVDYTDYALWQRENMVGERLRRTVEFWRARMAGAPPMQLPSDRPPVPLEDMCGAVLNVRIPADIVTGLETVARGSRTTMFAVLMAAVQLMVWSRMDEKIVTVSAPVGGRTQPELDDLVGCFVHGMLFPTDMGGDPTFAELVGRVRDGLREAWEHQNMPLREMAQIQEFATVNGMGTQGIALEWTDLDVSDIELPGGVWTRPWWPTRAGQVDMPPADLFIHLHRSTTDQGIAGEFMYNAMRFDVPEIESVFEQLREVLRLVAQDPDRALSSLRGSGTLAR